MQTFTRHLTSTSHAGLRCTRNLHSSVPALRAKVKARAHAEEPEEVSLFEDDDLFGSTSHSGSSIMKSQPSATHSGDLSVDAQSTRRSDTFNRKLRGTQSRLSDLKKNPQALRRSIVVELLRWADSGEQLEDVVEVVAAARGKLDLHSKTAHTFIGRCISLRRPDIALKVLSQRPKYGLDIPDLKSARTLLHSIFRRATSPTPAETTLNVEAKPFTKSHEDDALLLAALYPRFKLGAVSNDSISATLLLSMFTRSQGAVEGGERFAEVARTLADDFAAKLQEQPTDPVPRRQNVWEWSERRRKPVSALLEVGRHEGVVEASQTRAEV